MLWNKKSLSSKISVRLVKRSWKPKGLTSEDVVDEFPGTVQEAFKILRTNSAYDYVSRPLGKSVELFTDKEDDNDPHFQRNMDSIILVHPIFSNADENYFVGPTLTALAMRNLHKKYNIFVFHMPSLQINMFLTILLELKGKKTRYEPMAEVLSQFIIDGIQEGHLQPSKIHFVGYSFSGNLVGYIARYIFEIYNDKVSSILCLDPYSAQHNDDLIHVNKDDADVVHMLHTSSYVEGTRERIAHADFVFNDGFLQPECVGMKTVVNKILSFSVFEPTVCSHIRVVPRFWYVILYPSRFKARRCDTWPRFKNCLCEDNEEAFISYPILSRDDPFEGTYFIKTTGSKPYGQGEEGSHCNPKEKEKLKKKRKEIIQKNRPS